METSVLFGVLLKETCGGRLEPLGLEILMTSTLIPRFKTPQEYITYMCEQGMSDKSLPRPIKDQLRLIVKNWDTLAENFAAGASRPLV